MSENVLETHHLSKQYGAIQALNDFTLNIPQGATYGILGPNGSGKTTLLSIILGVVRASKGEYNWNLSFSDNDHFRIGALLERPNFYPYISGRRNLQISAHIKGVEKKEIDRVLALLELSDRAESKFKTYSTGMKQRLAIAAALLGDPDVLVLDEPTGDLDPQGIAEIRKLVQKIAKQNKTILLSSHLLDEIEKICSHVAILKEGELISAGSVEEVIHPGDLIELKATNLKKLKQVLEQHDHITHIKEENEMIIATIDNKVAPAELNKFLAERNIYLSHLTYQKQRLEDHFLRLMEN